MSSKVNSSAETGGGAALVPKLRFPDFQEADGWETAPGDKLFQQVNNREAPPGLPILAITQEHGAIPRHMIDYHVSVTEKSLETYKEVRPEDFIISLRSFQGGIEFSDYHGICSPAYVILRKRGRLSNMFYRQYFKSHDFIQQLTRNLEGLRDGKMVSYKQFSELQLLKPILAEQQKIADCLESADALIAAQGRKVDALRAHKKGLMKQLFPQGGETQPRRRFPEFEGVGEWEEVRLNTLGDLISGLTYSPDDVREEGLLVLRSSNIQRGKIDLADCVYVDPSIRGANISLPNDILVCVRNGSSALIGKTALIPEAMPYCTHGAFMTIFRSNAPKFVFQLFQTSRYHKQVAADLGATINSINGKQFLRYSFFVPKPPEQQRIADCLTSLDDLIAAETRKFDTLKAHKKGLIHQLFPRVGEGDA